MDYKPKYFELPADDTIDIEGTSPYVLNNNIAIAVDVALATERPLLIAGPPGSGKSRLADAMAALLGWNYLSHTLTSRTRLEELTGELDHLQRLHDANVARSNAGVNTEGNNAGKNNNGLKPDWAYRKPGVFWWAYDAKTAKNRGGEPSKAKKMGVTLKYPDSGIERKVGHHTVLLLDEIDKAEPDLPNDLLEPLDRKCFSIPNGGFIEARDGLKVLTIITTNRERQLPPAFLRRCVTLNIQEDKDKQKRIQKRILIGQKHYPQASSELLEILADRIDELAMHGAQTKKPGASEFLDAVHACLQLDLKVDSDQWNAIWPEIEQAVMVKNIQD